MLYAIAIVVGLVLLLLLKIFLDSKKRYGAATNVVFAKYTHSRLKKAEQQKVHDQALAMILESGVSTHGFANEVERYGWYAVAMDRLGIPSQVPDNPCWHKVDNPYAAIPASSYLIKGVCNHLRRHYSIDISVDPTLVDVDEGINKK